MNVSQLRGKQNVVILGQEDFSRIRALSSHCKTRGSDLDEEKIQANQRHQIALKTTETWANSITNTRKARLNRLQAQKEQKEEEQKEIDRQEKNTQKAKRKEALEAAQTKHFHEKPEIRAVHSKILLHEVIREREKQILFKERKKELDQMIEDAEVEQEREKLRKADERERELAEQRRQRSIQTARIFHEQLQERQERKIALQEEDARDEEILVQEAKRLEELEKQEFLKKQERERKNIQEMIAQNHAMQGFKARQARLEKLEDERIMREKIALDEEMDRRAEAEKQRRQSRQDHINKLIEIQAQKLQEIKANQKEFEDNQYEMQWKKEQKDIVDLTEKQKRLAEERRRDYLEAQKKIEAQRARRKEKHPCPSIYDNNEKDIEYERKRAQALKDLAAYQRQQALEKHERETAEKERAKLEFQHQLQLEEEKTREAQEYAYEMLMSIQN